MCVVYSKLLRKHEEPNFDPPATSTPMQDAAQGFNVTMGPSPIDAAGGAAPNVSDRSGDAASAPDLGRRPTDAPSSAPSMSAHHGTDTEPRAVQPMSAVGAQAAGSLATDDLRAALNAPPSLPSVDDNMRASAAAPSTSSAVHAATGGEEPSQMNINMALDEDPEPMPLNDTPRQRRSLQQILRARGFPYRPVSVRLDGALIDAPVGLISINVFVRSEAFTHSVSDPIAGTGAPSHPPQPGRID